MKNIVITGSTRGIGYGLAQAFVTHGCSVVISGRSQAGVDASVQALKTQYPDANIVGFPCDVTRLENLRALWAFTIESLGSVDIWINNAGVGHPQELAWKLQETTIRQVMEIDLLGLIFGTQVAVAGMLEQGYGQVYNMEGFGSDGMTRSGMSVYGAAKRAVRYYTRSVTKEVKDASIQVGTLSPGIVITDFITDMYQSDPQGLEKSKKVFNILGDRVETVTPWLAKKALNNRRNGVSFRWLTTPKVLGRFLTAGFKKRNLFLKTLFVF